MAGTCPAADDGPTSPAWLGTESLFRVVRGAREATELLTDRRVHADMAAMFEGAGYRSGPVWEAAHASLLSMNGEQHRRFRSVVANQFTPRAAERIRPVAARAAAEGVETMLGAPERELQADFAIPYVSAGICHYIGFPVEDVGPVSWAVERLGWAAKDLANRGDALLDGLTLADRAREALDRRREQPTDDVLGAIAAGIERGDVPDEVGAILAAALLSAGHEPTANQLGILVAVLSEHPDLWDALGEDRVRVAPVLEELLRFRSTNVMVNRRIDEPLEFRGVAFGQGEQIMVDLAAANHDPRRFAEPDRVDPDVNHGPHLAFGFGAHYCLGAAVSRVQMQEALTALTGRLRCPRVLDHVENEGAGLRGPVSLTISVEPRTAT
jgi:cytochrome P450